IARQLVTVNENTHGGHTLAEYAHFRRTWQDRQTSLDVTVDVVGRLHRRHVACDHPNIDNGSGIRFHLADHRLFHLIRQKASRARDFVPDFRRSGVGGAGETELHYDKADLPEDARKLDSHPLYDPARILPTDLTQQT